MTERFPPRSTAYTKEGHAYIVDEVEGGIVYCSLPNGTETDFPEEDLFNEKEWASRSGGRTDVIYGRIRRDKAYSHPSVAINQAAAERILFRADNLVPGLLDYAAFTIASASLSNSGYGDQITNLSIIKCRDAFDSHEVGIRVNALANVLDADAQILASIANLGDNLLRAIIDKGMAKHHAAFEEFCDRPRR